MQKAEISAYWKKCARMDHKTATDLFASKNYVGCLFFVHLYLEKILKGLVQHVTGKPPPFTHDLLVLARLGHLDISPDIEAALATINTFNIRARYADYKFAFYKKATRRFTETYLRDAEELYSWFSSLY